ncbi:MAG: hypothetical protein ACRD3W_03770, partial [Terriglobales bacterium]
MIDKKKECLVAGLLFFAMSSSVSAQDQSQRMQERIESAKAIIAGFEQYDRDAKLLMAEAANQTKAAKRLKGEAQRYQSNVIPKMKPLTGAKLSAAQKMYRADLQQFSQHAQAYRQHMAHVREVFGQCEASRRAFEANAGKFSLHCDEFHMGDIPPPHICLEMGGNAAQALQMAGETKGNMQRLAQAEMELMYAEHRLTNAMSSTFAVDESVRKQHDIN